MENATQAITNAERAFAIVQEYKKTYGLGSLQAGEGRWLMQRILRALNEAERRAVSATSDALSNALNRQISNVISQS